MQTVLFTLCHRMQIISSQDNANCVENILQCTWFVIIRMLMVVSGCALLVFFLNFLHDFFLHFYLLRRFIDFDIWWFFFINFDWNLRRVCELYLYFDLWSCWLMRFLLFCLLGWSILMFLWCRSDNLCNFLFWMCNLLFLLGNFLFFIDLDYFLLFWR